MDYRPISFKDKFTRIDAQWQPKVIAEMNDYQFKVVKLQGDFIWHDHRDTVETFIVLDGVLRIDFRDGAVLVSAGEIFVIPKGIEHRPSPSTRSSCCSSSLGECLDLGSVRK
jgi:mannose-6-phosphate isomerase-like protein (cupin superfamily)